MSLRIKSASIGALIVAGLMVAAVPSALAQTVKIGVVNTFSGPFANFGDYAVKSMRLYDKLHAAELPAGVKVEFIIRDDGGPNPDKAKQLAQELIVRDKVQILAGAGFTPNALAIAPLATQSKTPFLILNAGSAVVTTKSPYIARFSFTMQQSGTPLGSWASKTYKTAYTLVADYSPGVDSEVAFTEAYKAGGGTLVGSVRVPPVTLEFAPFLQRVKDAKPDVLMVFVPAGKTATGLMKGFVDLGLKDAGIKLIGPGDIAPDEELVNMDDGAVGVTTVYHYSAWGDRPANKAFNAAWTAEYGASTQPNTFAVSGWDAMAAIYQVIKAGNGTVDGDKAMEVLKTFKNPDSPRGAISIDPETRDIVQNEYLREVRKVGGKLENIELETLATALKDPWKEAQKKQ
jgi:branched-chain amino acid transport system substrate-binding protein